MGLDHDGVIRCVRSDFHPYECGGEEEGCPHCLGTVTEQHNPATCALCHWDDDEQEVDDV